MRAGTPVRGTAMHEKARIDPLSHLRTGVFLAPVKAAKVRAELGGEVVAEGRTADDGTFILDVPPVHVTPELTVIVAAESAATEFPVKVTRPDPAGTAPAHEAREILGLDADLLIVARGDAGGAFNALAAAQRGMAFLAEVEPGLRFPPLRIESSRDAAQGTHFAPESGVIRLRGGVSDDAMDDVVVLHELGHYAHHSFSTDSSPGGAHHLCSDSAGHSLPLQDIDPRLAFSEAFASCFAGAVLGDSLIVNTRTDAVLPATDDLERGCLMLSGTTGAEADVRAAIWDLIDGPEIHSKDGDPMEVGFAGVWEAMRDLRGASHVFLGHLYLALRDRGLVTDAEWDAAFATTLGLPVRIVLQGLGPVLRPNATVSGAVDASLGQSALRAASRTYYVQLTAAAGELRVELTPGAGEADLDLEVITPAGVRVFDLGLTSAGEVRITHAAPGCYLVRVFADWRTIGSAAAAFRLQITTGPTS